MQSLDIVLKFIQAILIYNIMLREGVPKLNGSSDKIQVVITSGIRYNIGQGMLFLVYRNNILNCWYIPLQAIAYF